MKFYTYIFIFFVINCSVQAMRAPFLLGVAGVTWIKMHRYYNRFVESTTQISVQPVIANPVSDQPKELPDVYPDGRKRLQGEQLDHFLNSVLPNDEMTRQASPKQRNMDALGMIVSKWKLDETKEKLQKLAVSMDWQIDWQNDPKKIFSYLLIDFNFKENQRLLSRYATNTLHQSSVVTYERVPLFFRAMTDANGDFGDKDLLKQLFVFAGNQIPIDWSNEEKYTFFLDTKSNKEHFSVTLGIIHFQGKSNLITTEESAFFDVALNMIILESKKALLKPQEREQLKYFFLCNTRNSSPIVPGIDGPMGTVKDYFIGSSFDVDPDTLKNKVLKHPALQTTGFRKSFYHEYLDRSIVGLSKSNDLFHNIPTLPS